MSKTLKFSETRQYEKLKKLSPNSLFIWREYYHMVQNIIRSNMHHIAYGIIRELASFISSRDATSIIDYCCTKPQANKIKARLQEDQDYSNLFEMLWHDERITDKLRYAFGQLAEKYEQQLTAECAKNAKEFEEQRCWKLKAFFKLNDKEFKVFISILAMNIFDCLSHHDQLTSYRSLAAGLNMPLTELHKHVGKNSRLQRYRCMDDDLDIELKIMHYISGLNNDPLESSFYSHYTESALPWKYYDETIRKHGKIIKSMLNSHLGKTGLNILLYGEPGSGKTSFAQSLAAELGRELYMINQHSNGFGRGTDASATFRFAAARICGEQVSETGSMIVIDEADDMLRAIDGFMFFSRPCGDKGMLNDILDKLSTPCIWIANTDREELDPSSRRRFDYSIRFSRLSDKQRELIWRNNLKKHQLNKLISTKTVNQLASVYPISAGGIANTVKNIAAMSSSGEISSEEVIPAIARLIKPHCELMNITPQKEPPRGYIANGINIKGDETPEMIINGVKRFYQELSVRTSLEDNSCSNAPWMNILLSGPPGTGKTEFVHHLGHLTSRKVNIKMASDFINCYIGETEKNIRRIFEDAENTGSILFIDEADGMFRSRHLSQRSWEVTQVNELLYSMEHFAGVLVCATNFANTIDPATLRRFTFKLEFDFLTQAGKRLFFKQFFASMCEKSNRADWKRLDQIQALTPGDFRTVYQKLHYISNDHFPTDRILCELEAESENKSFGRKESGIGFGS